MARVYGEAVVVADVDVHKIERGSLIVLYDVDVEAPNMMEVLARAYGHTEIAVLHVARGGRVKSFTDAGQLPAWIAAKLDEAIAERARLADHVARPPATPKVTVPRGAITRD